MKTNRAWIAWGVLICGLAVTVTAQQMPQDNWYVEQTWSGAGTISDPFRNPAGLAVGGTGLVYVADTSNKRIVVFQSNGTYVRKWGSNGSGDGQFGTVARVATDTNGLVYVTDSFRSRIQVFQPDGTFVRKWGSAGIGSGQFGMGAPTGIAFGPDGLVYVADGGNGRIQVFQPNGAFVRQWGSPGSLQGQFGVSILDVAVDAYGMVYVTEMGRLQVFQPDGTFVRTWPVSSSGGLTVDQGQLVYAGNHVLDQAGTVVRDMPYNVMPYNVYCVTEDGLAYTISDDSVFVMRRVYRNPPPLPINRIPQPAVLSVEQRAGAPYLDIDYKVIDPDNATVAVAALAFANGGNTLNDLLKLNTLIEGTVTNIGPAVQANQIHRLTWNAAADWSTNFGQVKIEILAKDNRDLLDFHFLRIPSNGPDPELVIDRSPLTQSEMLSCWYWLIATNDLAVTLSTGRVVGVSAPYNGKVLAQGTDTTSDGRAFLFQRLGVREATSTEVSRARGGYTPGVTNQWAPRITGDHRKAVNELGFDTYNYGATAWFVVKP